MVNARREALYRALRALDGDLLGLSSSLNVPMHSLCSWFAGETVTPMHVFLRAVDIIDDVARRARGRRAEKRGSGRPDAAVVIARGCEEIR